MARIGQHFHPYRPRRCGYCPAQGGRIHKFILRPPNIQHRQLQFARRDKRPVLGAKNLAPPSIGNGVIVVTFYARCIKPYNFRFGKLGVNRAIGRRRKSL